MGDLQERLRDAIKADGRSQRVLSEVAGIPRSNISRLMTRHGGVSFPAGVRLARVVGLGLDVEEVPGDECN